MLDSSSMSSLESFTLPLVSQMMKVLNLSFPKKPRKINLNKKKLLLNKDTKGEPIW